MGFLFFLLMVAMYFDLKSFCIPNRLIIIGYVSGFLYQVIRQKEMGCLQYPLAAILMYLALIPIYQWKVMGGGDVKLLSVCAMFTGFFDAVSILFFALLTGAVISIFCLVYHRWFFQKDNLYTKNKFAPNVIHFSVPICLGFLAQQIWGDRLWQMF